MNLGFLKSRKAPDEDVIPLPTDRVEMVHGSCHLIFKRFSSLNIKRVVDRRLFTYAYEPFTLRTASVLVEPNRLGVVVVDLTLVDGDDRATARLVDRVVVKAHFAEGRETHLCFRQMISLGVPMNERIKPVNY